MKPLPWELHYIKTNPQLQSPAVPVGEWLFEEEFETLVTADSANNTSQAKNRIFYVKNKLLGFKNESN